MRVAGVRWDVEECLEEAKRRSLPSRRLGWGWTNVKCEGWDGWYRHITMAMLANAYLAAVRHQALAPGCLAEMGAAPAWTKG